MYEKVTTDLNFAKRENEILEFWKKNDIHRKNLVLRKGAERFTFYDGPPTANGKPHIGHVLTRAIKDIIPRHRTMKGYDVLRKAGWDTHGLPVELEVEKLLDINGKPQIEEYGVGPFIAQCKESVWKYKAQWQEMSDRVAYWVDMEDAYITYTNDYIESVWWSLKQIWDKGLIYKGHKVVPYCPRCGTALSTHEVAQGYKDIREKSIFVKFRVAGKEREYFIAWTTTPWTLPSNVALTVHPDSVYATVKIGDERYILAKELVESVFPDESTREIVEERTGRELAGIEYEPLFRFANPDKKAWFICTDHFVTLTEGSGIVHTAPAFGEDDAKVGRDNDLPFVQLVDEQGKFVEAVSNWKGVFVKDADAGIIEDLRERSLLLKELEHEHSYPFCWRCDTPLLYYARNAWFIRMTAMRENLLRNNNSVHWMPDNVREGRFGNFLDNVMDWGLSRERYWGTPLPIWECAECGHRHMVGSIAELKEMGESVPDDIELHKPYIDEVHLRCPECGKSMKRIPEVIDCWYDSGAMPFAQMHYPFENKDSLSDFLPARFISEAIDQTRGWFYTLLAISTLLFDKSPYENVIVLGHVLDKDGQKMSKHKHNVVDPSDVLDVQGADAVRWYFYANSAPWLPCRFSAEAVSEGQRKFMGTLWNTYAFYILYAQIDGFNPTEHSLETESLGLMDRWVLSRLHSLIRFVDENLEEYKITESAREIQTFVDELSNWYVRRCRERFWQKGMEQDKINAYMTLYTVIRTVSELSAPFVPFITEMIYQNLVRSVDQNAPESIHLCDFPKADDHRIDKELERNMQTVLDAVVLGRACRNTANIKNRQPLGKLYIVSDLPLDTDYAGIVKEELNVKTIELTKGAGKFTTYRFKPQLRTVGPKYGKMLGKISQTLAQIDGDAAMEQLENEGKLSFSFDGTPVELSRDDLLIETARKENFVADTDKGITVVLDVEITPELLEEGYVREIVSKVQNMRKEAGFEVQNHILLGFSGNDYIESIIRKNGALIFEETLADGELLAEETDGIFRKEWMINGEHIVLTVCKNI